MVLSAVRYGDSSKIVRLATEAAGVQSAIAKGALRPRSRFGSALQVLSDGTAHLILKEHRELQLLTAFDVGRVRVDLAGNLARYAPAAALAEIMRRFAPAEAHRASFRLLRGGLDLLETGPDEALSVLGLRLLWRLVDVLGFAPALDRCVRDGRPVSVKGDLSFSSSEGGALCAECARSPGATVLPGAARHDLTALLAAKAELPVLDALHAAAHRRLLTRYVRYHLADGAQLPALEFWDRQGWNPA